MQSDSPSWSDLYNDSPPQQVDLDPAGQVLLDLIPEHERADKEPVLRGMLSMMRLQLGERSYVLFCEDMKRAYEYHQAGECDAAARLFGAYGIPYDMLVGYADG